MCGVIVVDAESFRSTCHGHDAYIHDHCLRYHHNFALFYQLLNSNLFTHHRILMLLREAASETYGPRVYFPSYKFPIYNFRFLFTSFAIFYFPFHKPRMPKILLYHLSISIRSHFANNREGIDNPFIALGASWCLFVQVFGGLCVVSYWIDTLVLKTEGDTYSTLLHHPFLFKGKTNASSRSSRKNFWRRCPADLRQVKTYQVPS